MTGDRKNKDDTTMGKTLRWLPLATLALVSAMAWGSQQATTTDHERRITGNEKLLQELMKGQARIEERSKRTSEDVRDNKDLLLELLREFRNGKGRIQ